MNWGNHFTKYYLNDNLHSIYISQDLADILSYLYNTNHTFSLKSENEGIKIMVQEDIFNTTSIGHIITSDLKIIVVLDRNLTSEIVNLYNGKDISLWGDDTYKLICSLYAYSNITGAFIDPSISIYEGSQSTSSTNALHEVEGVRVMNNLNPLAYIDLFYEEYTSIPNHFIDTAKQITKKTRPDEKITNENFNKLLDNFKVNYPIILKAILINNQKDISAATKIQILYDWIFESYFSKAEAIVAAQALFYESDTINIIKGVSGKNSEDVIKVAKNATWDLTYITYLKWKATENPGEILIFATKERKLRALLDAVFISGEINEKLKDVFGKKTYLQIEKQQRIFNNRINERGTIDITQKLDSTNTVISELEKEIILNKF